MPTGNNFVTIPWADGTNDNLYMDFSKLETGEPIQLSSDDNSSKKERAKIFEFKGNVVPSQSQYQASAFLKVVQQVDGSIVASFDMSYSIYK